MEITWQSKHVPCKWTRESVWSETYWKGREPRGGSTERLGAGFATDEAELKSQVFSALDSQTLWASVSSFKKLGKCIRPAWVNWETELDPVCEVTVMLGTQTWQPWFLIIQRHIFDCFSWDCFTLFLLFFNFSTSRDEWWVKRMSREKTVKDFLLPWWEAKAGKSAVERYCCSDTVFPVKLGNERLGTRLVVTSKSLQIWVHMLRVGKYRHSKFTDGSVARLFLTNPVVVKSEILGGILTIEGSWWTFNYDENWWIFTKVPSKVPLLPLLTATGKTSSYLLELATSAEITMQSN